MIVPVALPLAPPTLALDSVLSVLSVLVVLAGASAAAASPAWPWQPALSQASVNAKSETHDRPGLRAPPRNRRLVSTTLEYVATGAVIQPPHSGELG